MRNNSITALIVEDDRSWQEILTEIITDYGLQVEVCDNLQSAVAKLHTTSYRLAIVDLALDGEDHKNQDGLKILNTIKQSMPDCVSILLTGYASVELAMDVIQEYGAFTCLRKETFRRVDFREVIRQALATPQSTKDELVPKDDNLAHLATTNEIKSSSSKKYYGSTLVVEDDAGWRSLLSELITESGFKVQTCTSYGEALGLLMRENFHLAVVDLSLANTLKPTHNQDGYRLLAKIRESGIPAIIVSGSADLDLIDQAYSEYNVFACLEKQSFDRNIFLETLHKIIDQKKFDKNLTNRELEVLALIVQGHSNKEIASQLFISTNTVKRHLKSIFAKLDVSTRAAASAYATRIGLTIETKDLR